MNPLKFIKYINTAIAVGGTVITTYQTMIKVAKWYDKKYGKKKKKNDAPITRPIIKGV